MYASCEESFGDSAPSSRSMFDAVKPQAETIAIPSTRVRSFLGKLP
jgi:hypothetical protein